MDEANNLSEKEASQASAGSLSARSRVHDLVGRHDLRLEREDLAAP